MQNAFIESFNGRLPERPLTLAQPASRLDAGGQRTPHS
jgi:hypothetical protein